MAERLAPLPATQVARVQFPVPAGPRNSVEMVALFPASGGTFSSTAIKIIDKLKISVAKAKMFPHLEARVRVERGIPHSKDSLSLLMVQVF
jgi:hypothetical protein